MKTSVRLILHFSSNILENITWVLNNTPKSIWREADDNFSPGTERVKSAFCDPFTPMVTWGGLVFKPFTPMVTWGGCKPFTPMVWVGFMRRLLGWGTRPMWMDRQNFSEPQEPLQLHSNLEWSGPVQISIQLNKSMCHCKMRYLLIFLVLIWWWQMPGCLGLCKVGHSVLTST